MEAQAPLILEKWDFIVLLGESGSGKGTLVKNIMKYWLPNLVSASMGEYFRERSKTDPELRSLIEQGILVEDKTVCRMFREFANENVPALMDGYPRNRAQTLDLIKFIKEKNWRVLVIDIHCKIEIIIERLLSRGRDDDKLAIMYKRNADHKTLHPNVMAEIKSRPDLFDVISVDGNFEQDVVFSNFLLDVLRLVDMLYFYDLSTVQTSFRAYEDETSINPAINRWICAFLNSIQEKILAQKDKSE